ncbi:MAG: polyprenyl synthetase family protein [Nitriliruptoraceae bacterium]
MADGATAAALPERILAHVPAVDDAVADTVAHLGSDLVDLDPALGAVAEALADAAAGGKRLRPALLCWSFAAHGGGDPARILGPAVALELVHTCALVHDDVIDRTDARRGAPTVHARFAARRTGADVTSEAAASHGRAVAILLGDVALSAADGELLAADVDPAALARAHAAFTRLRVEVMAGQFLDVDAAARRGADRERALRVATLKSARYSVGRPLELGALRAGADDAAATRRLTVGDPVGRAFQLRDDLLGVFGDPAVTGKPAASDLAEGKRTLLVAEALARLDPAGRETLEAGLGDPGLDTTGTERLRGLLEACGARAAVEAQLDAELAAADAAIEACGLDAAARADLRAVAAWAARRDA